MTPSNRPATVTLERRRHYRLSSRLNTALRVGLVMSHGTEDFAEVVDLSASGTSLRWPAARMVVVDVGQEVELRVQPCTADESLTVHAAVRWRKPDDSDTVRYGLEFQERADLAPSLCRLFDRRHGPR
jgi:c-di-GMP-binding flagellar brake protein YcgR